MAGDSPDDGKQNNLSPQGALYARFLEALNRGDWATVRELVDVDAFSANLPGQHRLVLDQFIRVISVLRDASPDFGQNVTILDGLERDGRLCIMYRLTFTMAGRLVEYTSTDWVTFRDGKIVNLHVLYDRADTQEQVFGRPLI